MNSHREHWLAGRLAPTTVLLTLLIALGIFFRVRQYAFDRSLWLDEALLSQNIIERPLDRLLTEPLENNQAAPLGLLLLAKGSVILFGESDLVLRLVPLAFGILGLFLSLKMSRHAFQSDAARVTFVGLVAVSPILIYYSSEIKQYGIDASVAILLLWASFKFKEPNPKSLLALALIGSLAVWLSHPSAFVLAAIGATFLIQTTVRQDMRATLVWGSVIVVWLANFWIDYSISLDAIARNDYLVNYWRSGYAPLSLDGLAWYWESALGLVYLAFRQTDLTVVTALVEWFDGWNYALLIVTIAGLGALFKHSRQLFSVAALTIIATVAVSSFQIYPFRNRLLLFLVPIIFAAASGAVDRLVRWRSSTAWLAAAMLVLAVTGISIPVVFHPHNAYDIKGALNYIRVHRAPDDAVALQFWSAPAFHIYEKSFGLDGMPLVATMTISANVDTLLKSICTNQPRRTWIIFSHVYEERIAVLEQLRKSAPQLDAWEGDNAGTFLFDFSYLGSSCSS